MSFRQVIECVKCGHTEQILFPESLEMPWEHWTKGCPRCGSKKVDVYLILDKMGVLKNKNITIRKLIGEMRE
jgi:Zn finger protein HypA/HybF involved in hydrogenase expression